jgi:iron complex transport system ATP-binding protein
MIRISNLEISYQKQAAIRIKHLEFPKGQLIALAGPNGAGKSSLLKGMASVLPYRGDILLTDQELQTIAVRQRAKQISYLPQGRQVHWSMRIWDVVALGRLPHQNGFEPTEKDISAINHALEITETQKFADRSIQQLSGGELARVLLARALAVQAPILLCDEPTANLDPYHQHAIMQTLQTVAMAGTTVIVVLHDLNLVMQYCAETVLLHQHGLIAQGKPQDILNSTQVETVFGVKSHINHSDGKAHIFTYL